MKVWIVTTGSYSDYAIDSVFATLEAAEACVAMGRRFDDASIEEYDVWDKPPTNGWSIGVVIARGGELGDLYNNQLWRSDAYECFIYGEATPAKVAIERTGEWGGAPCVRLTVTGTDRERVLKVFSERRAMLLAMPWVGMTDEQISAAVTA